MSTNKILSEKSSQMQAKVLEAPLLPGCYIYRDKNKKILYIGKAKILRNRIKSYFNNYNRVEEKIRQMIDQACFVDFFITDSEVEALLLESNLIKKYKPKYNSMLVDDKQYVYVKFDLIKANKSSNEFQTIPSIKVVRTNSDKSGIYFGPYPDSRLVKRLLKRLRKIFPYCTSNTKVNIPAQASHNITSKTSKPCFYAHLGLCNGACAGYTTRSEYETNIKHIKKFFSGEKSQLQSELEKKMKIASTNQEYENAARYRNMINDIKYVGSNLRIDKDIDEVAIMKAKQDKKSRALVDLIAELGFPEDKLSPNKLTRIECYDISNIQGTSAVGSMVVSIGGDPRPDMYRRFRIRMKNEPNDFAMMQEILTRRFAQYLKSKVLPKTDQAKLQESYTDNEGYTIEITDELRNKLKGWKLDESFSHLPDLIIIDGGKGQLTSAYEILQMYKLTNIPIVGLAKKEEEIFKLKTQFNSWDNPKIQLLKDNHSYNDDFIKIKLSRRSESLYLVQRIRDEAHRFAITYHRKVRAKKFLPAS